MKFLHGITAVLGDEVKKKQDLNLIYPTYKGFKGFPGDSPGAVVMAGFAAIFERQGCIAEGTLTDIFFGFETSGWDISFVGRGMTELKILGMIYYTDENHISMPEEYFITNNAVPWVRYSKKFLDCFKA